MENLNLRVLNENIRRLHDAKTIVNEVIFVPQVKNLEDELVRSTDISTVQELLPSSSIKEYKHDLAQINREKLALKLQQHHFEIEKLWYMKPSAHYKDMENGAAKIKQKK